MESKEERYRKFTEEKLKVSGVSSDEVKDDRDISKSEEYLGEIVGMMRVYMILIVISLIGSLGMCVRAM
jgi:hypothetical protein